MDDHATFSKLDNQELELLIRDLKQNTELYKEIISGSEQNLELNVELIKLGVAPEMAPKFSIIISGIVLRKKMKEIE